jgi:Calcineurin-like phosphoesterase
VNRDEAAELPEGTYRILQLSDLHFGVHSYYSDGTAGSPALRMVEDVSSALEREKLLDSWFDLLVLSGDLTCQGAEGGMEQSIQLAEAFRTNRFYRDILVIPGNHDMQFGEPVPEGDRGFIEQQRFVREDLYRRTYRRITQESLNREWMGVLKTDDSWRLAVFGLDSCRIEGWRSPGVGYIGMDQLQAFADELWLQHESPSPGHPWRRICFVHHHIMPLSEPDLGTVQLLANGRQLTCTLDAYGLIEAMDKYGIDLVAHGHFHRPAILLDRVYAAGSAGVRWPDCDNLQGFYVYEIQERPSPLLRTYDFQRRATDPVWRCGSAQTRPLRPRHDNNYLAVQPDLYRKAQRSEVFLHAYHSWPLAKACLGPLMGPAAAYKELERRLKPILNELKSTQPNIATFEQVIDGLLQFMNRNRDELLRQFEKRLETRQEALPFEQFLLDFKHLWLPKPTVH